MKRRPSQQRRLARSPWVYAVLALVASTATAISIFSYTSGIEKRVIQSLDPIDVLIASEEILPGTTLRAALDQGLAEVTSFPSRAVPKGALTPGVREFLDNETVTTIDAGSVLLGSLFPPPKNPNSLLQIPRGLLATTIDVSEAAKVGSFLRPYDYVVVYLTTKPSGIGQKPVTTVLLAKALVLAVGDTTERGKQIDAGSKITSVTLGLTPTDSLTLVAGQQSGEVYLGLLSPSTDPFER